MYPLNIIKGNALNKGRARVWVESSKLVDYGFKRGEPITITHNADDITIRLDSNGKRKVAGRERDGKQIGILDICYPLATRDAQFGGATKLLVEALFGVIRITAIL